MSCPRRRSRSGWRATSASSSATTSAWRPSAMSASIRSSRQASWSSSSREASTRANGSENSASAAPRHSCSASRSCSAAVAGRTACECGAAGLPEGGEAVEVERAGLDLQRVAGRMRQQRVRGQQLAQLRHVDVDHLHRRAGHVLSPQVVDELVDGDGPAGLEQQPGQQRALAPATQGHRCAAFAHLERTEDPELHVTLEASSGAVGRPVNGRVYRTSTGRWPRGRTLHPCPPPLSPVPKLVR